jgi:voltage-gated potassium channel
MDSFRRLAGSAAARAVLTGTFIVGLYYLVPVEPGIAGVQLAWRVAGTVVGVLVATWLIVRQVSHQLADPEDASLFGLLTAIVVGVTFFALADYTTAVSDPDQFVDLETKTDGLYFALATLTTVGYGDVHAAGQIARGVVAVQLLFNVVVVATAASVLARQVGARARRRRSSGPPP